MNRRRQRALEKAKKKERNEARRAEALESLSKHEISHDHLSLFKSTRNLGRKTTAKERMTREIEFERAGIADRSTVSRKRVKDESKSDSESESESDSDSAPVVAEASVFSPPLQLQLQSSPTLKKETSKEVEVKVEAARPLKRFKKESASSSSSPARDVDMITTEDSAPAFFIPMDRDPAIQAQREQLPIFAEEQAVMEAIKANPIVVICGDTGSGKTTQVPQFLYEAGYGHAKGPHTGMIGVTQPRRVAAVTMAARVGQELGQGHSSKVGYQIRYEKTVSPETVLKFMTDGVLLREIQNDFLLKKYSVIILDEAHERNLNTDVLVGLLSRVVRKRNNEGNPLKLVIMSATLRVTDFTENAHLFSDAPPVLNIAARQYPVTIHFSRRTELHDYVGDAFNKVMKIHRKLPAGDILVFLTGQGEIMDLCSRIRRKVGVAGSASVDVVEEEKEEEEGKEEEKGKKVVESNWIELDEEVECEKDETEEEKEEEKEKGEESVAHDLEEEEDEVDSDADADAEDTMPPAEVLPLFSALSPAQQQLVFERDRDQSIGSGSVRARRIIVSTNVAETSVTIPAITYVVDCGRAKSRVYEASGISQFQVGWISKASAQQRAGRAGRVGPGHVYRLYSSAVYERQFEEFTAPEIHRLPLEDVVLKMKAMYIDSVKNFPFPTPPDSQRLKNAIAVLQRIGAVDEEHERITALGKRLAVFPLSPRLAKMLVLGQEGGCLHYVVAMVAALSVSEVFVQVQVKASDGEGEGQGDENQSKRMLGRAKHRFAHPKSDMLGLLRVVGGYSHTGGSDDFCVQNCLNIKAMREIQKLRKQLMQLVTTLNPSLSLLSSSSMQLHKMVLPPLSAQHELLLRQILAGAYVDQAAHRYEVRSVNGRIIAKYESAMGERGLRIHPSSNLVSSAPEWIVFNEITKGASSSITYLKHISEINVEWLHTLAPSMCVMGDFLQSPPPKYDRKLGRVRVFVAPRFGYPMWRLPVTEVDAYGPSRFRYFARFLLEGHVFPQLAQFSEYLLARPVIITKTLTDTRCLAITQTLADNQIDSKKKLVKKWETDRNFLLSSVALWVNSSRFERLKEVWQSLGAK